MVHSDRCIVPFSGANTPAQGRTAHHRRAWPERKRSMPPAKPHRPRRRFSQDLLAASSVAFPGWLHAQGKGKEIVVGGAGRHKIFLDPLIPVFEKQNIYKNFFQTT